MGAVNTSASEEEYDPVLGRVESANWLRTERLDEELAARDEFS